MNLFPSKSGYDWLKLGSVVLQEKIVKSCRYIFAILLSLSSLVCKQWTSYELYNLDYFYLWLLCVNFGWILRNGSGKNEWMKILV